MKKLPIIIMLSAAGITGVAMAQTSSGSTSTGYGTSGTAPSTGATSGMDGAAGTTGYGTGPATSGAKSGMNGAADRTMTTGGPRAPNTSGTAIGKDIESYGKDAGVSGSRVSPQYGTVRNGAANGAAQGGTTMTTPSGTSGMTWTCPAGYTLSTATRDGTPLCYPNTGPMPGR